LGCLSNNRTKYEYETNDFIEKVESISIIGVCCSDDSADEYHKAVDDEKCW